MSRRDARGGAGRPGPRGWPAGLAVAAILAAGCAPSPRPRLVRLPEASAAARFSLDSAGKIVTLRSWDLPAAFAARGGAWSVEPASLRTGVAGAALEIDAAGHRVTLAGPELQASECPLLDIEVHGLEANGFVRAVERSGGNERTLAEVAARDGLGDRRARFLLPLPATRDPAAPLAVVLGGAGARVSVAGLSCGEFRLGEPEEPSSPPRAWRIEAGDEVRDGFLLTAERPLGVEAAAPGARRLRFAAASLLGADAELAVHATVRGGAGPVTVTARVRAGGAGWSAGELELPAAGSPVAIRAEVVGERTPGLFALASIALDGGPSPAPQPRVVLISIDTLRADRMSLYGARRETTPVIDAWARAHGVVFDQAIAAAPSTLPSHASLLTGLEVLHHGAFLGRPLPVSVPTLAERFRAAGWRTLAVTGGGYLHPYYGLDRGFEVYRSWPRHPGANEDELADGLARVRSLLSEHEGEPVFLFFHTYEVHAPYRAREPWFSEWTGHPSDRRFQPWERDDESRGPAFAWNRWPRVVEGDGSRRDLAPDEVEDLRAAYDSGVAVVDREVGALLGQLSTGPDARRTTIVLTADHGESLGENRLFDHGFLYDSNLRVPLVIARGGDAAPGAGRRVARPVRSIDVAPTLAALAGLPPAPAAPAVDGISLEAELEGRPDAADRNAWSYGAEAGHGLALRTARLKYIVRDCALAPGGGGTELYDLTRDPGESHDLAGSPGALPAGLGADPEGLAERARRYWSGARRGLFARLVAPAGGELALTFGPGPWSPLEVHGFPGDGSRVELDADGRARILVAAGADLVLRFDGRAGAVEIGSGDAAGGERVSWDQACRGWSGAGAGATGLSLLARGDCAPGEAERANAPGREVTDALRALGYLR
jgi:arylsulfatase A-like enzyme